MFRFVDTLYVWLVSCIKKYSKMGEVRAEINET